MTEPRIASTRRPFNRHVHIEATGRVLEGPAAVAAAAPVAAASPPAPAAPAPPAPAPPAPAPAPVGGNRKVVIQGDLAAPAPARAAPAPARPAPAPAPRPAPPRTAPPRTAPPRPPAAAPPRPGKPKVSAGRWAKRLALAGLVGVLLLVVGGLGVGWWAFNQIEKVEVADVLSPPSPTGMNILVVGTDSREGIDAEAENADAFLGGGFSDAGPSRTDTMMILRIADGTQTLLSIPRDLWVRNPVTGENGRINAVYQSGRPALIQAVQGLGIPVHHYMEINFVSFAGLVDAVGGIEIDFPHPARDTNSGLDIPEAGTHTLDGIQALAYVRSRYYTELIDGEWVSDPTADLGRVTRQRAFVSALLRKVAGTKNPFTAMSLAQTLGDSAGLKIDDAMTYPEALGLAWQLRSFDPASETLPVVGVNRGGASTLDLAPGADAVIAQFQ